jgi:hypothetical protein
MPYIGNKPEITPRSLADYDSFTGDGSTVAFDLEKDVLDGGINDLQVYVNNVRQEPGASKAFTLGEDGSGNLRRITFNTAPANADEIYVINPGRQSATIGVVDSAITSAKLADTVINGQTDLTTGIQGADELLIYDSSASANKKVNLDNLITGQTELTSVANDDVILVYDTDATEIKKITKANFSPAVSLTYSSGTATGDGSTQAFTINSGRSVDDVLVIVNGIILTPTTDYTIASTTLTFTTAPAPSAQIDFRYLPITG